MGRSEILPLSLRGTIAIILKISVSMSPMHAVAPCGRQGRIESVVLLYARLLRQKLPSQWYGERRRYEAGDKANKDETKRGGNSEVVSLPRRADDIMIVQVRGVRVSDCRVVATGRR